MKLLAKYSHLIGSTKEERDLFKTGISFCILFIILTYFMSCGQRYVNAIKAEKEIHTSVDGQGK